MTDKKIEDSVVTILGTIYAKVNWARMGSRSSYDIFEHRIEYSKNETTIGKFIQRLCDKVAVQSPSTQKNMDGFLAAVDFCRKNEKESLHLIRTEGKLLTLLAAKKSREMKNA